MSQGSKSRMRTMLAQRNADGVMTLEELGAEFGVTRERVRQIEEKALQRVFVGLLRLGYSKDELRSYLEKKPGNWAHVTPGMERHGYNGNRGSGNGGSPHSAFGRFGKPHVPLARKLDEVPTGVYDPTWSDLDSFGASDSLLKGE